MDKGSDRLQLIKFWPSCAHGKGSAAAQKNWLLQRAVFAFLCQSLSAFFILTVPLRTVFLSRSTVIKPSVFELMFLRRICAPFACFIIKFVFLAFINTEMTYLLLFTCRFVIVM